MPLASNGRSPNTYADFGSGTRTLNSRPAARPMTITRILRGRLNYRFGWDGLQK
jgi:hypothetical protein